MTAQNTTLTRMERLTLAEASDDFREAKAKKDRGEALAVAWARYEATEPGALREALLDAYTKALAAGFV